MNLARFRYRDKRGGRSDALSHVNRSALARQAGVSRSHMSRILSGQVEPPLKTLRAIAQAVNATIDEVDKWLRGLKVKGRRK